MPGVSYANASIRAVNCECSEKLRDCGEFLNCFYAVIFFRVNVSEAARIIIILGAVLIALGVILPHAAKLGFFGKLPGDIKIEKENFSFYFPIATCIVLSVVLTFLGNLFFRK